MAFRSWRSGLIPAPAAWDVETVEEYDRRTSGASPSDMDDVLLVSTDPAELAARLLELAYVGFDRLYLHHVGREQNRFLDLAAEHLIPALRGR